ncbi:MAG: hypothetical protein H7Z17_06265 [Fuerstia sp.]|nr:hypothetical protein [Fuerstiella sp.]
MGGKKLPQVCGVLIMLLSLSRATAQRSEESLFGITIRNATLEQRLVRTRTEQEPVSTNILGSDVQGQQTTTTETRIRIVPDAGCMRFDVVSTGDVSSQTTGVNPQVMIDSTGRHHFEITKPFWFNGKTFLTKPGYGTIQASQAPRRVVSAVGATMPLLRPLSDRVAWDEVTRRQAEINQAVAEDVTRTVLPKFDRIVDEEFTSLKRQLAGLQAQVESTLKTSPMSWVARSSETSFSIAAIPQSRSVVEGERFNSQPVNLPQLANGEEVAFTLSDSVATALLEKYVPGGLVLTDTQVEKASKVWNKAGEEKWSLASLMQLFQEIERNSSAEPTAFSIQLAKVQPIAIRFDRGDVCIETSFQILPKGAAPSGWMKTTWRMRGRGVSDSQWAVALRQVDVGDAEDSLPMADVQQPEPNPASPELRIPADTTFQPTDGVEPVEQAPGSAADENQVTTVESGTVWMSVVKDATQSLLKQIPVATLPKEFELPTSLPGSPRIRVVRIESADGVLRAAFRLVDCAPQP